MKKTKKIAIIVAAALVVSGGILTGVGIATMNESTSESTEYETYTDSFDCEEISSIVTDCRETDITVTVVDGDSITLNWTCSSDENFSVSADDGVLEIYDNSKLKWYEYIRVCFGDYIYNTLEIGIPEGYIGALTLETASGNIDLTDLDLTDDLSVSVSSGTILINEVTVEGALAISLVSGDTNITNAACSGTFTYDGDSGDLTVETFDSGRDFSVSNTSGKVEISELTCISELAVELSSGRTVLSNTTADTIRVEVISGNIKLNDVYAETGIDLKTVSGGIRGTISDNIENYSITSKAISGGNNLPDNLELGDKTLSVEITSGSIEIEFNE